MDLSAPGNDRAGRHHGSSVALSARARAITRAAARRRRRPIAGAPPTASPSSVALAGARVGVRLGLRRGLRLRRAFGVALGGRCASAVGLGRRCARAWPWRSALVAVGAVGRRPRPPWASRSDGLAFGAVGVEVGSRPWPSARRPWPSGRPWPSALAFGLGGRGLGLGHRWAFGAALAFGEALALRLGLRLRLRASPRRPGFGRRGLRLRASAAIGLGDAAFGARGQRRQDATRSAASDSTSSASTVAAADVPRDGAAGRAVGIALGGDLEQQDGAGDGRVERPDRAAKRDPDEQVAALANGRARDPDPRCRRPARSVRAGRSAVP